MKLKKIIALAGAVAISIMSSLNAFANEIYDQQEAEALNTQLSDETVTYSYNTLPGRVDLSTSPCFPPIVSQGNTAACVAFATTYYQYSYEVNKLNNVTSVEDREIYSPRWTYTLNTGGTKIGVSIKDVYDTLKVFGCVKESDFPFIDNYNAWLQNDEEAKLEALKTRLSSYGVKEIPVNQNIQSPSNLATNNIPLSEVKTLLNDGKVLVVGTKGYFNSAIVNGECLAYRCYTGSEGGHELTIVGYDNFKAYDINGNGTIESYEKGAFKVANSWGTSFDQYGISSNDGYFWIMYDALNLESVNTDTNWESSLTGTRYPAFCKHTSSTDSNKFYYINVEHKELNLVGEINIDTNDKWNHCIYFNRLSPSATSYSIIGQEHLFPFASPTGMIAHRFNGVLLFDYGEFANPIRNYLNNYKWYIKVEGNLDYTTFKLRILDSEGNVVSDYDDNDLTNESAYRYKQLNLKIGDINYDGQITEDDVNYLMDYNLQITQLSNLQYCLADINGDGKVGMTDLMQLRMLLPETANTKMVDDYLQAYAANDINSFMQAYNISIQ